MKKKITVSSVIIVVLGIIIYFFFIKGSKTNTQFTYAEITRGSISKTILSTGTLQALSTVEIGTQVSGRISKLFADFNSNVRKGQLLAILDTTLLAAQVRDSRANLDKTRSEYNQLLNVHQKNIVLYEKQYISEVDFIASKTNLESASANVKSAESSLDRAKTNLSYAYIHSPISVKVLNRSIEEGQTVAASFSSPTLFTIAEDLSHMKILANVDESDIGQIEMGQKVDFSVQAYPDKKFFGQVVQIRMNSQVVSNVVNYTVIVNADNNDYFLLPGMTATLDFYIQEKDSVLLVPNTALRFIPTDEMMVEFNKDTSNQFKVDTAKRQNRSANFSGKTQGKRQSAKLWYLDESKKLRMSFIEIGITDGKTTEIVRGRNLKEGMKVISGIIDNTAKTTTPQTGNSLLNTANNTQRGVRRGM